MDSVHERLDGFGRPSSRPPAARDLGRERLVDRAVDMDGSGLDASSRRREPGPPREVSTASRATDAHPSRSSSLVGTGASRCARPYLPYSSTWSIVWFAPVPRRRGGRSGGQQDQRHAGLRGLDDGGEELGRCGAARARDGDRFAQRLRQPQREERARSLVEVHVRGHARMPVERQRQRRRT
jgi:hypothetical protein